MNADSDTTADVPSPPAKPHDDVAFHPALRTVHTPGIGEPASGDGSPDNEPGDVETSPRA